MARSTKSASRKSNTVVEIDHASGTLSEAERISKALKVVSREARRPAQAWLGVFKDSRGRPMKPFGIGIILAFIATVIIPIALSSLYLAVFTSDQYSTEIRFAVRGGEQAGMLDPISMLTGSASQMRLQDAAIVADYVHSRGIVELLDKQLNLREKFSISNHADYLFGFNPKRSTERLVKYWWWQVDVSIERMSGIITVVVRAFAPEDSQAIAQAIIYASEALVNELSERSRADALKLAQNELLIAERLLQDKIKQMRELRDKERVLDPTKQTEALTKLVGEMRLELLRMESEYEAQKRNVSEDAPQLRVLEARIRAAREQIRLVEARMTSNTPNQQNDPTLAQTISSFDRLKLEQEFAQKQYLAASAALERARIEVEAKQVYLTTFLRPSLAEEALYPKRWWIISAIALICLALWGIGTGLAILIRNHAA